MNRPSLEALANFALRPELVENTVFTLPWKQWPTSVAVIPCNAVDALQLRQSQGFCVTTMLNASIGSLWSGILPDKCLPASGRSPLSARLRTCWARRLSPKPQLSRPWLESPKAWTWSCINCNSGSQTNRLRSRQ